MRHLQVESMVHRVRLIKFIERATVYISCHSTWLYSRTCMMELPRPPASCTQAPVTPCARRPLLPKRIGSRTGARRRATRRPVRRRGRCYRVTAPLALLCARPSCPMPSPRQWHEPPTSHALRPQAASMHFSRGSTVASECRARAGPGCRAGCIAGCREVEGLVRWSW